MTLAPGRKRAIGKENTGRVGVLSVGSDVEDKLGGGSFRIVGQRAAFANEVILINVPLGASVCLQTANGQISRHADIMKRGMVFCRPILILRFILGNILADRSTQETCACCCNGSGFRPRW